MTKPLKGRPPGRGARWWQKLTKDEQFAAIGPYFAHKWRNKDIEKELDLSTGTVAGVKRRWLEWWHSLPSDEKLAGVTRLFGVSWPAEFNPRAMAAHERHQCTKLDNEGRYCGRVRVPGFDKCFEHLPLD